MSGVRWPCATRYPCTTEPNRRGVSLHLSLRVKTSRTAPDNGAFLNQGAPSEEEDHPGHGKILETVSFIKAAHAPPYNTKPVVGGVGIKPLSLYPGLFFIVAMLPRVFLARNTDSEDHVLEEVVLRWESDLATPLFR